MRALHSRLALDRLALASVTAALAVIATLVVPTAAAAQDQVIGLLTLPGLYGNGPCQPASGDQVRLYSSPSDTRVIGTIRLDHPSTPHPQGGCEEPSVGVHRADRPNEAEGQALPTREYGYEMPAAIVLDRRERWYRIRLADGAAWVRDPSHSEFLPLTRLLTGSLTYLTEEWDGRMATAAGAPLRGTPRADLSERPVRVVDTRRVGAEVWLAIELFDASPCESGSEPRIIGRGWVPEHAPSGEPLVWFYSRGC